jgi:predicted dehydrogenase/threonine dehydrogenase-like Zn-dependent dehydrogenase
MRQVLVRNGTVVVEDVPSPGPPPGGVVVRTSFSCISAGTELSGLELSELPLYRRAMRQPHHARRAMESARDQGLVRTYRQISARLASGVPTGYSAAGVVTAVGEQVEEFAIGDRVACAGAGVASHAEVLAVPVNLAARVPAGVGLEDACTATLGAIALQGVRRAAPSLGETVGVIGLGLIGQLTAQLLRAAGCRVLGLDVDSTRVELARDTGIEWGVTAADAFVERGLAVTDGHGLDAVVIAAASSSSDIVSTAFRACRRKGRVVVVGDVGLDLKRHQLYEKELDLLVSTSYGPGRYDPVYEEEGVDYPLPFVRWTVKRNLEEYLRLLAGGRVRLDTLPRVAYDVEQAPEAFEELRRDGERPLLVVFSYPQHEEAARARTMALRRVEARPGRIRVGVIGAGAFATDVHLPNLRSLGDRYVVQAVASRTGATAKAAAARAGAAYATTDVEALLADDEVDLVLIATRHDLHARLALEALQAGKHVLVEKPLALREDELAALEAFYADRQDPLLLTGFNRRFSPAVVRAHELLADRTGPIVVDYRMNAGAVPPTHWVHGPEGGGRNLGEACHIYDLFLALTGAAPASVRASAIGTTSEQLLRRDDNFAATVTHVDGSICTLVYTALGARSHPKERMEIFVDGSVLSLDDYRRLTVAGRRARGWRSRHVEKGHRQELEALADALRGGGPWPISLEEQLAATRLALRVEQELYGASDPQLIVS